MIQALAAINSIRAELGMSPATEIQKGTPRSLLHCPVANTLKLNVQWYASVSPISIYIKPNKLRVPFTKIKPVPKPIIDFLRDFDLGLYPHLEG